MWRLLVQWVEQPSDEEFLHVVSQHPYILLENSGFALIEPRLGDEKAEYRCHNLMHYMVDRQHEDLALRILNDFPETVLAKNRALGDSAPPQHLLQPAVRTRDAAILYCLLSKLSELLGEPGRLLNLRASVESLPTLELCNAMLRFPDLCLHAMRPMLGLQDPRTGEGYRRILGAEPWWTAGSREALPRHFWVDRLEPPRTHVAVFEPSCVRWVRADVLACLWRAWRSPNNPYRVWCAPPWEVISPRDGRESDPMQKTREQHEQIGLAVAPSFVAIPDAAGPPCTSSLGIQPDAGGGLVACSFLQACVDLSMKIGSADIFESEALMAVLDHKWFTFARYLYTLELFVYCCYVGLFSASCFFILHLESGGPAHIVWEVVNLLFTLLFCVREYLQYESQGLRRYLFDSWNYLDLSTTGLVLATVLVRLLGMDASMIAVVESITLLPAWLKLLWYMR
jgi:hypothetical protein